MISPLAMTEVDSDDDDEEEFVVPCHVGGRLELDIVDASPDANVLEFEAIYPDGIIAQWNASQAPRRQVTTEHRIVGVAFERGDTTTDQLRGDATRMFELILRFKERSDSEDLRRLSRLLSERMDLCGAERNVSSGNWWYPMRPACVKSGKRLSCAVDVVESRMLHFANVPDATRFAIVTPVAKRLIGGCTRMGAIPLRWIVP